MNTSTIDSPDSLYQGESYLFVRYVFETKETTT